MFAFAIYDSRKDKIFLARDRLGIKPLYYYFKDGIFMFASEIKSILQNNEIKRELDYDSINQFLTYRFVLGEKTILKDIKRLLPGHTLSFSKGNLVVKKYWDFSFKEQSTNKLQVKTELRDLLEASVKRRLMSDVPLGALLSGGLDSSSIVAMMSKFSDNVKTFTIGFEGESDNEFRYAKMVSERYGTDHHEIMLEQSSLKRLPKVIYHMDEPVGDLTTLPAYEIFRNAKKHVTVMLMGEGADEILMGYEQYRLMNATKTYNKYVPGIVQKYLIQNALKLLPRDSAFDKLHLLLKKVEDSQNTYYQLTSIFNYMEKKNMFLDSTVEKINNLNYDYEVLKDYFREGTHYLNSVMHFELKNWLVFDILTRTDRMTMAHSIEGRVPFLDHELVEFSAKIHPSLKLKGTNEKFILKEAMKDVLPEEIIRRKKQRFFTPIDHWFGNDFKELSRQTLSDSEFLNGLFKKESLQKLLKYDKNLSYTLFLKRHKLMKQYYARQIWSLVVLDMWNDVFVNDAPRNNLT